MPSVVLVALADEDVAARQRARSPPRCAPAASPARSRPAPQKFGKQIRYAERRGIPYVWFPSTDQQGDGTRSRTSAAATRSPPIPPPGARPPDLRPTVTGLEARSAHTSTTRSIHSDPHPRRRHPERRPRRRDRHPRRLGGPPPRPRRGGVHRPARGQRRRPGRRPRRGGRPQPAQRVLPQGHRRGRAAARGQRQPQHPHRRDRGHAPTASRC